LSEQVAIGIALGALGAVAQLAMARYRMVLLASGRFRLAAAALVLAHSAALVFVAIAAAVAPLTLLAALVGMLGMRNLVMTEAVVPP
jgi:hypothetical protein